MQTPSWRRLRTRSYAFPHNIRLRLRAGLFVAKRKPLVGLRGLMVRGVDLNCLVSTQADEIEGRLRLTTPLLTIYQNCV
jgi:hypothetical protein